MYMYQMFKNSEITDATTIKKWKITTQIWIF